ncbi:MAG: fibronectin type III domain-containing protein [Deltaproteobacteria bacterium]|jgi:hypothetical protein|nr:fibronectin type III domain-containing protein [Deltaproteobacteria bacterium]MBW2530176.1 fibronectin type III domain-containing protein [Deltaproteobacteria bacterium]
MVARTVPRTLAAACVVFLVALAPLVAAAASVTITWDPVPPPNSVDGYKVYYDVDSGPPYDGTQASEGNSPIDVPVGSLADPQAPELVLTGIDTCEVLYVAVTAYDTSGESDYSAEDSTAVMDPPDPVTVTGLTPEALEVRWAGLPAADGGAVRYYEVHYDTDSGEPYRGPGSPIVVPLNTLSDPDDPSFVLSSLTTGTTYYVAVRTVCAGGEGAMSEEVEGTPTGGGTGGSTGSGGAGTGNSGTGASSTGGSSVAVPAYQPDTQGEAAGCSLRRGVASASSVAAWLGAALTLLALGRRRRRR